MSLLEAELHTPTICKPPTGSLSALNHLIRQRALHVMAPWNATVPSPPRVITARSPTDEHPTRQKQPMRRNIRFLRRCCGCHWLLCSHARYPTQDDIRRGILIGELHPCRSRVPGPGTAGIFSGGVYGVSGCCSSGWTRCLLCPKCNHSRCGGSGSCELIGCFRHGVGVYPEHGPSCDACLQSRLSGTTRLVTWCHIPIGI